MKGKITQLFSVVVVTTLLASLLVTPVF